MLKVDRGLECRSGNPTGKSETGLWVVRLYDGIDNVWIDVSDPVTLDKAKEIWREKTNNGTEKTCYNDLDYFRIFPSDTVMLRRPKGI